MPDETLLSESTILLFGRVITDLDIVAKPHADGTTAIAELLRDKNAEIARIYGFAFQNEFFDLASPALFVVRGKGADVDGTLDTTGLAKIEGILSKGLSYWPVDREDLTVRLDIMTGPFDRILLDYELADDGLQDFVRGGGQVGQPAALGGRRRGRRGRWRSEED